MISIVKIELLDGAVIYANLDNVMLRVNKDGMRTVWVSGNAQGEITKEEWERITNGSLYNYFQNLAGT